MSLEILNNLFTGNFKDWENGNSFEKMSIFKNSVFGQYWEKNIPKYAEAIYGPCLALGGNNHFRIFDLSKRLSQTQAALYQSQIFESWDDIHSIVYANPDGDQVLKDYANQNYKPQDNEILFFIETNDGKIDFGKIVRVKLGKNAVEKLKFMFPLIGETDEKELADAYLKRPSNIKRNSSLHFIQADAEAKKDTGNLKNLLEKAINYEYNQKKFDDMSWFLLFLQGEEWIGLNTPKKLMEISQWMRTKKYEEEKYWNANLKNNFTPAFLPQFLVEDNNEKRERAIRDLVKSKIDDIVNYEQGDGITTKVYKEILGSILLYLFDCYYQSIKIIGITLTATDVLYNLNAFLVGLWNGCLEFLAAMIDLVALSMAIARDGIGYIMTDALAEKFENLLNEIVDNFEGFIKKLWEKFNHALENFPDWFLKSGINPYFWYKELGELTPDIITILVPALKGSKASKLGKAGTVVAEDASAEISEKIMQESAEELSEKLEENVAQKEVKESFKKANAELEDRIPKETEIEEVVIGGASKKLSSIWKVNLKEGKYNCANYALATDATLAGKPASALPYTIQKRFRNGKWENYASFDEGTKSIVLEAEFGAKFSDWKTNLVDLIKDLKPGKRGIVFGIKKGKNMGHYFNVINENGVIKYLDGQTGKRAKLVYDYYQFLPTN